MLAWAKRTGRASQICSWYVDLAKAGVPAKCSEIRFSVRIAVIHRIKPSLDHILGSAAEHDELVEENDAVGGIRFMPRISVTLRDFRNIIL